MIVSGEASGDALGAELVTEIRRRRPAAAFFGAAGPLSRAAGVEAVFESDDWSVVGVGAVVKAIPRFLSIKNDIRRLATQRRPEAVILIDFPEFNLKLAKALKSDGHRVIYYVSPQIWAWRKYRIRTIRECVDLLLAILPFEVDWYAQRGVNHVRFVGNPVAARTAARIDRAEFCKIHGLDPGKPLVALLPGSRQKEIERHLSIMLSTADTVNESNPDVRFVVSAADRKAREQIREIMISRTNSQMRPIANDTMDLLGAADAAAIASGTATLEAGVLGTPMVVIYRVPKLDYLLFKPIVDVPHFALINLAAGERVVNEILQNDLTPGNLAAELNRLLDPDVNNVMRRSLKNAVQTLGAGSPSARAAEAVLEFLDSKSV
jgi:lipid-A-disaccharide synthase